MYLRKMKKCESEFWRKITCKKQKMRKDNMKYSLRNWRIIHTPFDDTRLFLPKELTAAINQL